MDANILSTKQSAYIFRMGMDENVFCLKARTLNISHVNFLVFLDFRDAFGTLGHNVIIRSLEEIQLPQLFTDIVRVVYQSSFIQVICGK